MNRKNIYTTTKNPAAFSAALAAALFFLASACSAQKVAPETDNVIRLEKKHGDVSALITLEPSSVRLDSDTLLSLSVRFPSSFQVTMPRIRDRAEGFEVNAVYDREPVTENGITTFERRALLTPVAAEEYRLAPMPIVYTDSSKVQNQEDWFPTDPIELDVLPVYKGSTGDSLKTEPRIINLMPSAGAFLFYILLIMFACALLWASLWAGKKLRKQAKMKRMSPAQRALTRLNELLDRKLVEKNRVKDFYVELTMIVRRYIEEQHGIRAPEQTTEEFLKTVSLKSDFTQEVVKRLKQFLEAADLVKFAAYKPSSGMIQESIDTATNYIKADAEENNV